MNVYLVIHNYNCYLVRNDSIRTLEVCFGINIYCSTILYPPLKVIMIFTVLVFQVVLRMRKSLGWVAGCILCACHGGGAISWGFAFYQLRWADLWVALTFLERGHGLVSVRLSVPWTVQTCCIPIVYMYVHTYVPVLNLHRPYPLCVCVAQLQWHRVWNHSVWYSAWVFMYVGHSCLAHLQQLLKPWVFSGHVEIGNMAQNMTQVVHTI